jgi:hypothetical protein
MADEQLDPEAPFEFSHRNRDRGLGYVQSRGCAGDAPAFGGGQEDTEVFQRKLHNKY